MTHKIIPPELFPSCARGFHPGMYEGIPTSTTQLQIARNVTKRHWPHQHSRLQPREKVMGFRRSITV